MKVTGLKCRLGVDKLVWVEDIDWRVIIVSKYWFRIVGGKCLVVFFLCFIF